MLILIELADGPLRYFELRSRIDGISEKMLSQTLRTFCANGLIQREVDHGLPAKVTYSLTALGASLESELRRVADWIARHADAIDEAQRYHAEQG